MSPRPFVAPSVVVTTVVDAARNDAMSARNGTVAFIIEKRGGGSVENVGAATLSTIENVKNNIIITSGAKSLTLKG
jgi:hypothetical protein